VAAVEQKPEGGPTGVKVYAAVEKQCHHKTVADLLPQPEPVAPGPEASAKEVMVHRLKTQALQFAQADGGTGVWDHQRGDGVPAVPIARTRESLAGVGIGLRELQPQTDVHARKSGCSGIK
jgi:hypothetical protein